MSNRGGHLHHRMAITATTTDQSADTFTLLRALTRLQLTWSFAGTMQAEATARRVARRYGAAVEAAFLADSAATRSRASRS